MRSDVPESWQFGFRSYEFQRDTRNIYNFESSLSEGIKFILSPRNHEHEFNNIVIFQRSIH